MDKKLYVIMGATGHIGLVVSQELLRRGHRVRALGRSPKKLALLKSLGAETVALDKLDDASILKEAFHLADVVFSMVPPDPSPDDYEHFQDAVGEAIKTAIKKIKASHVLNLSSIGADLSEGTGPIVGLHRHEKRLNELSGVNVLNLRAGYFMENLMGSIPSIKQTGAIQTTFAPNVPLPMVATSDIGKKASEFLDRLNFRGHTYFDFAGPRELTIQEATTILGNAIVMPDLKYIQTPYDDMDKAMLAAGMKPKMVAMMREMNVMFNEEKIRWTQKITLDHRGKTTIEEFAKEFARAYQSKLS